MSTTKKKAGIARTTVPLPADLKRRMENAGEVVNWSAGAARAFETVLAEIAFRNERKNMDDVIQRLRASKQESDAESYKDGFCVGEEWAKSAASALELKRLQRCRDRSRDWTFETDERDAWGACEWLYFQIHPENDHDRREAEGFWDEVLDTNDDRRFEPAFLQGFANGALNVWCEAKSQV